MGDRLQMAGDVMSASAFFAGLVLTYLGASVAGYQSYGATAQESVRTSYWWRAWLAFAAFCICCGAGAAAFLSDWNNDISWLHLGVGLLAAAALLGVVCAFLTAWEV